MATGPGRFEDVARNFYETWDRLHPVSASWLGVHAYDDRLGDFSEAGFEEQSAELAAYEERLSQVNQQALPAEQQLDHELVLADLHAGRWSIEKVAAWRSNPALYVQRPLFGLLVLVTRSYAPLEERLRSAIGRMTELRDVFEAGRNNVENPPRVFTEVAIQAAQSGEQFLRSVFPNLARREPDLEEELLEAVDEAVRAFESHLHYLRADLLPRSNGDFAIGRELYDERLRDWHRLDLDAETLGATGERLVAETKDALARLAREIDSSADWPSLVEQAKQQHPQAGQLLDAYRQELERLKRFIRERDLVGLPSGERLDVVETPAFERSVVPYAAYMPPGPFDADQTGQFWVTPINRNSAPREQQAQLQEHCSHTIPIIALHEAYPGHHLQLVWANQSGSPVRKRAHSDLFAEGWAFYCEQLLAEHGYLEDPRARLFQLKDQLWRAARVVIDPSLHTGRMSFEEAVRFLVDEAKLAEAQARAEVRRYTMSPTQPMTYAIGKEEILRLRQEHSSLPLRQFHDRLLSVGTIPLSLAERAFTQ